VLDFKIGNVKFQKTLTEGMLTYNYDLILEIGTKILKIFHIGQFKETGTKRSLCLALLTKKNDILSALSCFKKNQ